LSIDERERVLIALT